MYSVLDGYVVPKVFHFNFRPGIWLFFILFFVPVSCLLGCATHLTRMAGVFEMFSEVNTIRVDEFKVAMVGMLQMEW